MKIQDAGESTSPSDMDGRSSYGPISVMAGSLRHVSRISGDERLHYAGDSACSLGSKPSWKLS
jgi:hypothetical protein